MKKEIIAKLVNNFDDFSQRDENGEEFWYARDLQILLGYANWKSFEFTIKKAKLACEASNNYPEDHFVEIKRVISLSNRKVADYKLSRYACYLIAQNGDPKKDGIAFAQTYFAMQARNMELIHKKFLEYERIAAREKLSESEKILSGLVYEKNIDNKGFGTIRSKGDEVLFGGYNTKEMKNKLQVKQSEPLADYLPTVTLKAKDLANEMTNHNLRLDKSLKTENDIVAEHIKNNKNVRQALVDSKIYPEKLPREENVKQLERRIKTEKKKLIKNEVIK